MLQIPDALATQIAAELAALDETNRERFAGLIRFVAARFWAVLQMPESEQADEWQAIKADALAEGFAPDDEIFPATFDKQHCLTGFIHAAMTESLMQPEATPVLSTAIN